jgi:hypothetical protein
VIRALRPTLLIGATLGVLLSTAGPATSAGVCFDHPNAAAAASALTSALESLKHAENDQGGWRETAVAKATEALNQVDIGCAAANAK